MEYTRDRVTELLQVVPWNGSSLIRLFWLRQADGSRDELASSLVDRIGTEAVVPLVLRTDSFTNANSVLSDVVDLFEANRHLLERLNANPPDRLTVLIIAKGDFQLVNASSPITLPDWFPVSPAIHTYFSIADLGQTAEVSPVNCPEARIDNVAQLLFELEEALVTKLVDVYSLDAGRVTNFIHALQIGGGPPVDPEVSLAIFTQHINSVGDSRSYRPNAAEKSKFLAARILKVVLNSSPKQLASVAEGLAIAFNGPNTIELKPTFFAVMWRPANKIQSSTSNWLAVMVVFFQAYQLMNANAHAGDFPAYSVSLQYANSINLRSALRDARNFVQAQQ